MLKKPRVQFNEKLVVHCGRKFFKETPEGGSRSNPLPSKYLAQHFINLHHRCVTKTKATNPDAHPKTLYYTHGIYPVVTLALRQTKLGQLLSGPSLVNQYFHLFHPATGCY
jgi:hypothetical protein